MVADEEERCVLIWEEEEQRERGLSPADARYAARRAFGTASKGLPRQPASASQTPQPVYSHAHAESSRCRKSFFRDSQFFLAPPYRRNLRAVCHQGFDKPPHSPALRIVGRPAGSAVAPDILRSLRGPQ